MVGQLASLMILFHTLIIVCRPALWTTDPDHWPRHGEIDVVEAVNLGNKGNNVSLHTSGGYDYIDSSFLAHVSNCSLQSVEHVS